MERVNISNVNFLLVASGEINQEAYNFLHEKIKTFNDSKSEFHKLTRDKGTNTIDVLVLDKQSKILGGIVTETYWGWLEIDHLWLAEEIRGLGIGRKLVNIVEKKAIKRGCKHAMLRTFSFQAKPFYENLGYTVVGQIENYPPGHSFYWLCKELDRNE
jgi:GNAT superfamily N-acetyltransferase